MDISAKLQFMVWAPWALGSGLWAPGLWAPWALGSGQDVLGSRVYWAPEITGLPGLPNRNLLSVFEAVKDRQAKSESVGRVFSTAPIFQVQNMDQKCEP